MIRENHHGESTVEYPVPGGFERNHGIPPWDWALLSPSGLHSREKCREGVGRLRGRQGIVSVGVGQLGVRGVPVGNLTNVGGLGS